VIPSHGIRKERSDVNLSHLLVAARQAEMRNAAANERLARTQPAVAPAFDLGAALRNVWSFLSGPADRPSLPTLTNYPFRG
jgi:hypothetical protein